MVVWIVTSRQEKYPLAKKQRLSLGRISHSQEKKVFWSRELFWHPQNEISEEVAYVNVVGAALKAEPKDQVNQLVAVFGT